MKVNYFDIQVIDTESNTEVVYLEKTAYGSTELIYNGADNLHQNIMTSELHFSFLVSELNTTRYNNLFTGSETRYQIKVLDVSVYNYPKLIWIGYLLPEQFSEPYKAKDYFINFIATDSVALLKNKILDTSFSAVENNLLGVLNVVNNCLLQTGLELPIRFSAAIQNAAFTLDYRELQVQLESYEDVDVFTVLEYCIKFLGCKLFVFGGYWYITGLNQQKLTKVIYLEYVNNAVDLTLDFVKEVEITKELVSQPFLSGAEVGLIPPFQTVDFTWEADFKSNLLPEDVVQKENTIELLKLWKKQSAKDFRVFSYYKELATSDEEVDLLEKYKNGTLTAPVGVYDIDNLSEGPYLSISYDGASSVLGGTVSFSLTDIVNNYIELKKPVFIKGKSDTGVSATLNLSLKTVGYNMFSGVDTPIVVSATVDGFYNIYGRLNGQNSVKFESIGHGLVAGDVVSVENEYDVNGDVVNDFYTGVYNVFYIDEDHFAVAKYYNASYVYTAQVIQVTNFLDVDSVAENLTNHFSKEGVFDAIDTSDPNVLPIVTSNNHGLNVGEFIDIPVKKGFVKRGYDGVHPVVGVTANTFQLQVYNTNEDYAGVWSILPFKENFFYKIIKHRGVDMPEGSLAEEVISNFDYGAGIVKGLYDFDVSQETATVKCVLSLDSIYLDADAYYSIRLYPLVTTDFLSNQIAVTDLEFNLSDQKDVVVAKTRSIDYTSSLSDSVFHNVTRLENTSRNLLISNNLQQDLFNGDIAFNSYVADSALYVVDGSNQELVFNEGDVNKVLSGFKVYKKVLDQEMLTEITSYYVSTDDDDFGVVYTNSLKIAPVEITTSEEIVLQLPTSLPTENAYHMLKSLWCRFGVQESKSYLDCLAKIYHDLYESPSVLFQGEITTLVGPLDLVNLNYNQENKVCTPTNLALNLSEGKTQLTIVENQQNTVSDYV